MEDVYVCSFSGEISKLTARQKKDIKLVLKALHKNPRVSTWEMSEHGFYRTINKMLGAGLITETKVAYPWHEFYLTGKGMQEIRGLNLEDHE